jgi:hypothetical protein
MVAQIFTDIKHFEIRVSWHDTTTGYVNGNRFQVEDNNVTFPGHPTFNNPSVKNKTRDLALALAFAVRHTPEFTEAKRESKSLNLEVTNGNFPGLFQVHNPLNGSIYNVVLHPNKTYCECPDHQYRSIECKHLKAVKSKQPKPTPIPVMTSYAGKAFSSGRLKSIKASDISDEQLDIARASLGI